jgi:hypothetical protein
MEIELECYVRHVRYPEFGGPTSPAFDEEYEKSDEYLLKYLPESNPRNAERWTDYRKRVAQN